jgi:hypothetical protein
MGCRTSRSILRQRWNTTQSQTQRRTQRHIQRDHLPRTSQSHSSHLSTNSLGHPSILIAAKSPDALA